MKKLIWKNSFKATLGLNRLKFIFSSGRAGIFIPFVYYRFLCMRYQSRRNPYNKFVKFQRYLLKNLKFNIFCLQTSVQRDENGHWILLSAPKMSANGAQYSLQSNWVYRPTSTAAITSTALQHNKSDSQYNKLLWIKDNDEIAIWKPFFSCPCLPLLTKNFPSNSFKN